MNGPESLESYLRIARSSIHGQGVFALRDFPEGVAIAYVRGYEVFRRNSP